MVWSVSGDGLRFAFQLDYCSFVAYKLWQDVSHGEEEEEAEEVQRGRSGKGHGQSTNRRASRAVRVVPDSRERRSANTNRGWERFWNPNEIYVGGIGFPPSVPRPSIL